MTIDDLREATDDASKQLGALITVCLLAAVYFAFALIQVSDVDYLTGHGQKLPIIDASVPTDVFLVVGPILILILHGSLLLLWTMYRRRLAEFVANLGGLQQSERTQQLHALYSFVLAASLVPDIHDRRTTRLAMLLVVAGLVIAPLLLLLSVQIRGLAYHNEVLTWTHRALVFVDIAAIWIYFPLPYGRTTFWSGAAATALLVAYATVDARIPAQDLVKLSDAWNLTDHIRPRRLDLRSVVLERTDGAQVATPGSQSPRFDLECRDLRFADLGFATLVRAALYGSDLRGATLDRAHFVDSDFGTVREARSDARHCPAGDHPPSFAFSTAPSADFAGQDLHEVDFTGALLVGASFIGANLSGARLDAASLDGAKLTGASLDHASLRIASLIGADLRFTNFANADLTAADLRGATFFRNSMWYATLHLADVSLSVSSAPTDEQLAGLREVLTRAEKEDPTRHPNWQTIQILSAPGIESGADKGMFGVLGRSAWLLKFDYVPMPFGSIAEPLSDAQYSDLLQSFIDQELKANPRLRPALKRRRAFEELLIPVTTARDSVPHISEPNEPPVDVVRAETFDLDATLTMAGLRVPPKLDARYWPWAESPRPLPKSMSWMASLRRALPTYSPIPGRKTGIDQARAALLTELRQRAEDGDALALATIPRILTASEAVPPDLLAWLNGRAKAGPRLDAPTIAAIARLNNDGSAVRNELLQVAAAAKLPSALLDIYGPDKNALAIREAAEHGNVDAEFLYGFPLYLHVDLATREKIAGEQQPDDKHDGWRKLAHAAYRGFAPAQAFIGQTLNEQGDFAAASRWLESAAAAGNASFENQYAWFLATCPVASYRAPTKALGLALELVRQAEAEDTAAHAAGLNTVPRWEFLDTLAAAYAANGDFTGAIETQTKVLAMLRNGPGALAKARSRLAALKKLVEDRRKAVTRLDLSDKAAVASAQEQLSRDEATLANQRNIQVILEGAHDAHVLAEAEQKLTAYKASRAWIDHGGPLADTAEY